jgi:hypothetical protein
MTSNDLDAKEKQAKGGHLIALRAVSAVCSDRRQPQPENVEWRLKPLNDPFRAQELVLSEYLLLNQTRSHA